MIERKFNRHHRLNANEIDSVFSLIYSELWRLYWQQNDLETAEKLFKVFYRFITNSAGRPKYPEFTWATLHEHLETWKDENTSNSKEGLFHD